MKVFYVSWNDLETVMISWNALKEKFHSVSFPLELFNSHDNQWQFVKWEIS